MATTNDVDPDANPPLWRRVALALSMFLTVGINGFLQPFVPLYFAAAGLTKAEIGWVTGFGTGAALLIQPLLGRLSDRIDARRPLMVAAALSAGAAYLAYNGAHGLAMFLLLTALGVNGFQYLNTVGGVLVGRLVAASGSGARGGAAYAGYRVWGSVGYILVTLTTGLLLRPNAGMGRDQLTPVFTYGPLLFFAAAVVSLVVPDVRLRKKGDAFPAGANVPLDHVAPPAQGSAVTEAPAEYLRPGSAISAEEVSPRETSSAEIADPQPGTPHSPLLPPHDVQTRSNGTLAPAGKAKEKEPKRFSNLDRFLISYFLYTFALYGASSYISLYMKGMGASPRWITATFAAGVVSEVLVMSRVGRWTDKYGRRPALAAAFLLMPLRLLCYIPAAAGPPWVLLVQTLHGLNFGIVGAVAVTFVNDHATEKERGSLQARLAATAGLALAISPVVCGWLAQQYSIATMFAAMSFVGAIGAAFFLRYVQESHPEPEPLPGLLRRLA